MGLNRVFIDLLSEISMVNPIPPEGCLSVSLRLSDLKGTHQSHPLLLWSCLTYLPEARWSETGSHQKLKGQWEGRGGRKAELPENAHLQGHFQKLPKRILGKFPLLPITPEKLL